MRTKLLYLIFVFFQLLNYSLFSQSKILSSSNLEKVIEPKLCNEKTVLRNVTQELIAEDFESFVYFIKTSYVAYDEMVSNGFNLNDFYININRQLEKKIINTSDDLIKAIYENLKDYIHDSHFSIANNNTIYCFNSKYREFKSNLSNGFTIVKTKKSTYLCFPEFLPDFFSEKNATIEYFEKVYAELNNIKRKKYLIIDFRNCPGGLTDYPLLLLYALYKGKDVVIPSEIYSAWKLQSDIIYKSSISIESPVTESLKYQRMIDTGNKQYKETFRTLSIIQENNPKRIVEYQNLKTVQEIHKPAYKGKIIFVTNNKTASAAESIILQCKVMFPDNVIVIGENTMGCLTYCDVYQFVMPNNSFAVSMAFKSIKETLKEFDCWKGEGIGIEPDVICSDDEILQSLIKITKEKNMRLQNGK